VLKGINQPVRAKEQSMELLFHGLADARYKSSEEYRIDVIDLERYEKDVMTLATYNLHEMCM